MTRLDRPDRDKPSSFINYSHKKYHGIEPWDYKIIAVWPKAYNMKAAIYAYKFLQFGTFFYYKRLVVQNKWS